MTVETNPTTRRSSPWWARWQQTGLRFRFLAGIAFITLLATLVVGATVAISIGNITFFVIDQFNQTSRSEATQQLNNLVASESRNFEAFLQNITADLSIAASYVADLLDKQESLGLAAGTYWDAMEEMELLSEGQWGNRSPNDPGSVLAPSSFALTKETAATLNSTIYLDLIIPDLLAKNPELLAIFYVSNRGATQYYPNVDLANVAGDFDARQRPYYQVYLNQPGGSVNTYWSEPYVDAALGGLVETNSVPVYNAAGELQGVMGADVAISTITDRVADFAFGEKGYAFLLDANGRFLAVTAAAAEDLGFAPGEIIPGSVPAKTAADITTEISPILANMLAGEQGVEIFTRDGVERFVAYAPIESVGYSLAIVANGPELLANFNAAAAEVSAQQRAGLIRSILVLTGILAITIALSLWVSNTLTSPIAALTHAAERVSAGDLAVQVNVERNATREVASLSDTFNAMTAQVRDLVGSLENQVASRTRALQVSTEVGRQLATILDPGQLVAEVVNQVQAALGYYHVHIYLLHEEEQKLVMAGGTGEAGSTMLAREHSLRLDQGLVGRTATTREPVLIPDVALDANWLPNPLLPETKSETAVPILYGDLLLGVLDVQHNVVAGLTAEDVGVLQAVAAQVAVALRNARLYSQAQRQADQQLIINEINRQIQSAANVETVMQIAARELAEALGTPRATIELGLDSRGSNGRVPGRN